MGNGECRMDIAWDSHDIRGHLGLAWAVGSGSWASTYIDKLKSGSSRVCGFSCFKWLFVF